jgi:hypothetical protein
MLNIRNCFELPYFGLIKKLFLQFISDFVRIRSRIRIRIRNVSFGTGSFTESDPRHCP